MNNFTSNNNNEAQGAYPEQGPLSADNDNETTVNQDLASENNAASNKIQTGERQELKNNMADKNSNQQNIANRATQEATDNTQPKITEVTDVAITTAATKKQCLKYERLINDTFGQRNLTPLILDGGGVRYAFIHEGTQEEFVVIDSVKELDILSKHPKSIIIVDDSALGKQLFFHKSDGCYSAGTDYFECDESSVFNSQVFIIRKDKLLRLGIRHLTVVLAMEKD